MAPNNGQTRIQKSRPRLPAAASKQRKKSTGVLVGIWKGCGLDANEVALGLGNTVYLSRDVGGRMRRRITKADIYGETILNSPYDFLDRYVSTRISTTCRDSDTRPGRM